ncbi:MAG: phage tail protein [Anaerolineae bacterium]
MPKLDRAHLAHPAFRFVVQIDGIEGATFTQCTLPTLEMEVEERKEGGFNDGTHILPTRVKKGTITLKRGMVSDTELLGWYLAVMAGQLEKSRRQVSIIMLDSQGEEIMRWDFSGVYPVKWTGPELDSASNKVAIEALELAYESLTVVQ